MSLNIKRRKKKTNRKRKSAQTTTIVTIQIAVNKVTVTNMKKTYLEHDHESVKTDLSVCLLVSVCTPPRLSFTNKHSSCEAQYERLVVKSNNRH